MASLPTGTVTFLFTDIELHGRAGNRGDRQGVLDELLGMIRRRTMARFELRGRPPYGEPSKRSDLQLSNSSCEASKCIGSVFGAANPAPQSNLSA